MRDRQMHRLTYPAAGEERKKKEKRGNCRWSYEIPPTGGGPGDRALPCASEGSSHPCLRRIMPVFFPSVSAFVLSSSSDFLSSLEDLAKESNYRDLRKKNRKYLRGSLIIQWQSNFDKIYSVVLNPDVIQRQSNFDISVVLNSDAIAPVKSRKD